MVDVTAGKEIAKALSSLLSLGADDTKSVRQEINELVTHTSATLRSIAELSDALGALDRENFTEDSFYSVYLHCISTYTRPDAVHKARTHCSDITRDIGRIKFKLTKILRTELGEWSKVERAFEELQNADRDFLNRFEVDMKALDESLSKTFELIDVDVEAAWESYRKLRRPLLDSMKELRAEIHTMEKAEDHIRRLVA